MSNENKGQQDAIPVEVLEREKLKGVWEVCGEVIKWLNSKSLTNTP